MASDLPLVRVRRRSRSGDYLLVEIDGRSQTWLNHPTTFASR